MQERKGNESRGSRQPPKVASNMTNQTTKYRDVTRVVPAVHAIEGGGVVIHRAFPIAELEDVDPFLLLDHFGPIDLAPGATTGFPDHPHRGFETVTYLLEGQMEHRDSFGHRGILGPGDVQWMTAGSGLVHSEMPPAEFVRTGGRLEGFQLWVNLPKRDKMIAPHYQELNGARIPVAGNADGSVRVKVIAGEALGLRGLIETRIPIFYLHYTLQPGARTEHALPASFQALAYVASGQTQFAKARELAVFSATGDLILIENVSATKPADVLLIGGEPLREPVARYGPFVMNTRAELMQAFEDYRNGRLGSMANI